LELCVISIVPVVAVLLSISNPSSDGQSPTGSIRGVVRDSQGASVPNARITIACGSESRRVSANAAGAFAAAGLPAAKCTLTTRANGFSSNENAVEVRAGAVVDAAVVLTVSGFSEDVLVSPTRGLEESAFRVPESTSVLTRDRMMHVPFTLMPQALREVAGVGVQQTTSAQTSPTVRGFTGQSVGYLVDGVRFNTSTWRSGPSQYSAWIDSAVVDRLELVRGPGSVQFGSDALGGTLNVRTLQPSLVEGKTVIRGNMDGQFGSADRSGGGTANIAIQGSRAAIRFGGSSRTAADRRTGGGIDSHAAVTRFLGLSNKTFGSSLRDTSFKESGAFASGTLRLDAATSLSGLYMHENLTGSSRYDRIYGGDGVYRSGFDPQTLDFGYLKVQRSGLVGFDAVSGTFSVNRQADGRFEQTRPTTVNDRQRATTTVYGYNVEAARSIARRHQVSVGADYYDERIVASRSQDNPITGVSTPLRPDVSSGTTYGSLGVFAQDVSEIIPNRLTIRGGLRYGRYQFNSKADATFFVPDEEVIANAFTYNAGAVVSLTRHINLTFATSRGFRAANASDLGTVGLTGGGGFGITPSRAAALGGKVGTTSGTDAVSTGETVPSLLPEVLYSYEAGLKVSFARVSGAIAAYDTEYHDSLQARAIVFPAGIVGQTISGFLVVRQDPSGIAYIQQDARPINTRVNDTGRARIQGIDAEMHARIGKAWTAAAYASMVNGRLLSTSEPLRRMTPPMGGARLRWTPTSRSWVEGVMAFARTQTRMNAGDLTDARIGANRTRTSIANYFNGTAVDLGLVKNGILVATGETLAQVQTRLLGTATAGTMFANGPGWVTFGLRGGYEITSNVGVTLIGENLTDKNYRVYGSGVDAPGRNLQVRLSLRF
jgi:hemoglobin/transferrin/lactoferrin receptor protein